MSVEDLDKEVTEAMTMRGKKNSNHREILRRFEMLAIAARPHGPRKEIPVLMHLVTSMFDTQHGIDDFMDLHQWNSCYRALSRVMSLLEANVNLSLRPYTTEELAHVAGAKTGEPAAAENNNTIAVAGSLFFFVLKLEQEYTKSLQQINPHTQVSIG
jgi:translation initiation factor 3 subunit C